MSSKPENTIIGAAFSLSVIGDVLTFLGFDQSFFAAIAVTGFLIIFGYAVYWALDIRRALSAKIFRNQALGMGLVSFSMAILGFDLLIPSTAGAIGTTVVVAAILVIFYWIDVSIQAAQHTDPLLRDPLHWRRVRWILWALNVIGVFWAATLYQPFNNFILQLIPQNSANLIGSIFLVAVTLDLFGIFVSGIIYIPISALKSRDKSLRTHLKWFASFLLCFLLALLPTVLLTPNGSLTGFLFNLAFLFGSYCLYRSARSLAPLERRTSIQKSI